MTIFAYLFFQMNFIINSPSSRKKFSHILLDYIKFQNYIKLSFVNQFWGDLKSLILSLPVQECGMSFYLCEVIFVYFRMVL